MGAVDTGRNLPLQNRDGHLILLIVFHRLPPVLGIHIGLGIGKILFQDKGNAHTGIRLHVLVLEHARLGFSPRDSFRHIFRFRHIAKMLSAPGAGGKAGAIDDIAAAREHCPEWMTTVYPAHSGILAIRRDLRGRDGIHLRDSPASPCPYRRAEPPRCPVGAQAGVGMGSPPAPAAGSDPVRSMDLCAVRRNILRRSRLILPFSQRTSPYKGSSHPSAEKSVAFFSSSMIREPSLSHA